MRRAEHTLKREISTLFSAFLSLFLSFLPAGYTTYWRTCISPSLFTFASQDNLDTPSNLVRIPVYRDCL